MTLLSPLARRSYSNSSKTKVQPGDYWLHLHEDYVQRVEIRFRRAAEARAFGFGHRDVDPE